MTRPVLQAYYSIMELFTARGIQQMNKLVKPGEVVTVSAEPVKGRLWEIACNPHKVEAEHEDIQIPPFHCWVTYNGWPWQLIGPFDAAGFGGDEASEENFINDLALEREQDSD